MSFGVAIGAVDRICDYRDEGTSTEGVEVRNPQDRESGGVLEEGGRQPRSQQRGSPGSAVSSSVVSGTDTWPPNGFHEFLLFRVASSSPWQFSVVSYRLYLHSKFYLFPLVQPGHSYLLVGR